MEPLTLGLILGAGYLLLRGKKKKKANGIDWDRFQVAAEDLDGEYMATVMRSTYEKAAQKEGGLEDDRVYAGSMAVIKKVMTSPMPDEMAGTNKVGIAIDAAEETTKVVFSLDAWQRMEALITDDVTKEYGAPKAPGVVTPPIPQPPGG
jgi:hypothetical protein